ncbi:hypothetical protein PT974_05378 [Cladobotryum mycophilum]|uniref:DDE Tnp4 domain-containing protein n=1 Tax=Cladobotryum mycophilum TaxID=491253 RepID=A0ABR0S8G2_9HYPO
MVTDLLMQLYVSLIALGFKLTFLESAIESAEDNEVSRQRIHEGGPEAANLHIISLLNSPNVVFTYLFRMEKAIFAKLCKWLRLNTQLADTRYQTVEHKIMVFLFVMVFGATQRETAFFFKIAQSTVSSVFHEVIDPMRKLHLEFVTQPNEASLSPEVELEPKHAAFSGCIGAIDGTHVAAHVPAKYQHKFWNRKNKLTQNVFAAVRFDRTFTYILAGGEGRLHDARLCRLAFLHGFRIPDGRCYLGDAGFGIQPGLLVPYPNTRYHLQDWRDALNKPETKEELYNLRHARLRIIIEQTFGGLKRKFKILRDNPPEYSFGDQVKIVYATTGLWNFIRKDGIPGDESSKYVPDELQYDIERAAEVIRNSSPRDLRDHIARANWDSYRSYMEEKDDENDENDEFDDVGEGLDDSSDENEDEGGMRAFEGGRKW